MIVKTKAGHLSIVVLVKGDERYVFIFDRPRHAEAIRTCGRFAANSELSFDWEDAADVGREIAGVACDSS